MRTFSYDRTAATAIARLYTVTLATGQIVRFTGGAYDITIGGNTWSAVPGLVESALVFRGDGSVSNSEIHMTDFPGAPISGFDIARGMYEGAQITVEETDFTNKSALLTGYTGNISINHPGLITIEARSPLTRGRAVVSERYSPMGRESFGDDRCRIPVDAPDIGRNQVFVTAANATTVAAYAGRVRTGSAGNPTDYANVFYECTTGGTTAGSAPIYNPTVGATTTDGSAVFTARDAWLRAARIGSVLDPYTIRLTSVPDPRAVDGWFNLGKIINRTDPNKGFEAEINTWVASTLTLTTWAPVASFFNFADWVEIARGCDKTQTTCLSMFNNIVNRRAETFAPGRDLALTTTSNPVTGPSAPPPAPAPAPVIHPFGSPVFVFRGDIYDQAYHDLLTGVFHAPLGDRFLGNNFGTSWYGAPGEVLPSTPPIPSSAGIPVVQHIIDTVWYNAIQNAGLGGAIPNFVYLGNNWWGPDGHSEMPTYVAGNV